MGDLAGIPARPAWLSDEPIPRRNGDDRRDRAYIKREDRVPEWLPRPVAGRTMHPERFRLARMRRDGSDSDGPQKAPQRSPDYNPPMRPAKGEVIHLMIVPGPGYRYQIVRVGLNTPVARGFATQEGARNWIARAVRQGVLPEGVVEVEPPPSP